MKPIYATPKTFAPFGKLHEVIRGEAFRGNNWECWMTEDDCLEYPAVMNLWRADILPLYITKMVCNTASSKMLLCVSQPLFFLLGDPEKAGGIKAFILSPGKAAVFHKAIWHSPCYGLKQNTLHYQLEAFGVTEADILEREIDPVRTDRIQTHTRNQITGGM